MKTIATYSIKGGVGKTTAAVGLAAEAALAGARVLLWDLDPQGAATFLLRTNADLHVGAKRLVGPKGNLDRYLRATSISSVHLVPADLSLRNLDLRLDGIDHPIDRFRELLAPMAPRYDVALLDCPPALSLASESVFGAADALLVPTIPSPLSVRTLAQLDRFLGDWAQPPIVLPFVSMYDARRTVHRDTVAELEATRADLLATRIPVSAVVERMAVDLSPLTIVAPRAAVTAAFRSLWADVSARLWPVASTNGA